MYLPTKSYEGRKTPFNEVTASVKGSRLQTIKDPFHDLGTNVGFQASFKEIAAKHSSVNHIFYKDEKSQYARAISPKLKKNFLVNIPAPKHTHV